ncbi:MAG: hypothetical protein IJA62_03260 [Ruminococcus sp.]|nr:hypothetical protein [Ruminococcus sp.]
MKNLKRITGILLAVVMILSLCACSQVPKTATAQWSYKNDAREYAMGIYVYSLMTAYNQAYTILSEEQGEDFDKEASILSQESSFDEAGKSYVCRDWVLKEADYITRNLMAIDNMVEEFQVEIDPATEAAAYDQARKDWDLGPYYEEYRSYGYSAAPYKDLLEPMGISYESFYDATYLASVKQTAVFNRFYHKGGLKAVSEKEISEYFEENYSSYSYFTVNLYESTTDSTTNQTVNTPLPEAKIKEIKENLSLYSTMMRAGNATFEEVIGMYAAYAGLDYDPSASYVEDLDNSSLPKEVAEVVDTLKDEETKIVYLGSGDTTVAYYLYKKPVAKETKSYIANESNYDSLLQDMKNDEFNETLREYTDKVECEVNTQEVNKFTPELIESLI